MSAGAKLVGTALYLIMLGMLISGSANTILMKVQNNTVGEGTQTFNHPYLQCAIMFMGEFLCMIVYIIKTQYIKHNTKEDPDAPPKPMG